jgi:hypothetical protein
VLGIETHNWQRFIIQALEVLEQIRYKERYYLRLVETHCRMTGTEYGTEREHQFGLGISRIKCGIRRRKLIEID